MQTLFINIKELYGIRGTASFVRGRELSVLPSLQDAYLLVSEGLIEDFGRMEELESKLDVKDYYKYDVSGQLVLPGWCDSHTHLVFAGTRENEFIDKLQGLSYAQIAAKGGGILNSAKALQQTSEDGLFDAAFQRLRLVQSYGTTAIEIKSGYGLTPEAEIKMLRVIKRLQQHSDMLIKSSFLGAHAYPEKFKNDHAAYIDQIVNEMLPQIGAEKLADFVDVFCEEGFFSVDEMVRICNEAKKYGLVPKLHVNQMNSIGGIQKGIELGALSLDHLETMTAQDVADMGVFEGAATILPTAAFFLRMKYQPARELVAAGAALTLASDFNPGSSPSGNMNFAALLSCIQLKLLPEEVINAATINGAGAMNIAQQTGSIAIGKRADLIFTKPVPSLSYLFYSFGDNHIDKVMIHGNWVQ